MSLAFYCQPPDPEYPLQLKAAASVISPNDIQIQTTLTRISDEDAITISSALLKRRTVDSAWIPGRHATGYVVQPQMGLAANQRMVLLPDLACGRCEYCRSGLRQHCKLGHSLGVPSPDETATSLLQGGMMQTLTLPYDAVFKLPEHLEATLTDEQLSWLPELAALQQICSRLKEDRPPRRILVLGRSTIALRISKLLQQTFPESQFIFSSPEAKLLALSDQIEISNQALDQLNWRERFDLIVDGTMLPAGRWLSAYLLNPLGRILPLLPMQPVYSEIAAKMTGPRQTLIRHLTPGWKVARHFNEQIEKKTGLTEIHLAPDVWRMITENELQLYTGKPILSQQTYTHALNLLLNETIHPMLLRLKTFPFCEVETAIYEKISKPELNIAIDFRT